MNRTRKGTVKATRREFVGGALATFAASSLLTAGGRPALAQALEKLSIATTPLSGEAPVFIARDRGYFKDEGLDIDFQSFASGGEVTLAVASRAVDVGVGALNAAYFNLAAKGVLVLFAGGNREHPHFHNNGFIVTNAAWDNGMRSVQTIKGARVGLTGAGGGPHLQLALILQKYGMSLKDVVPVFLQSTSNQIAAFKGGQIDMLSIPSPVPDQLQAEHAGHIISWGGDEISLQIGVSFATPDTLRTKRPLLAKFLRAYIRGCGDYSKAFNQLDRDNNPIQGPGYDELLDLMSRDLNLPKASLAGSKPYIDPRGKFDTANIATQIKFFQANGFLTGTVDLDKSIDKSFGTAE